MQLLEPEALAQLLGLIKVAIGSVIANAIAGGVSFLWIAFRTGKLVQLVEAHEREITSLRASRHEHSTAITALTAATAAKGD